jgi:hypothetical protein
VPRARLARCAASALAFACASASAQGHYKSTAADGKVTYGDSPTGSARALNIPPDTNIIASPRSEGKDDRFSRTVSERRKLRDALQAQIDLAREKLAAAEAALAAGQEVGEDERQWTQSFPDPGQKPDKEGKVRGRGGKVVCRVARTASGENRTFCPPIPVPNEAYYARIARLEAGVSAARSALDEAVENYRRNAPD